MPTDDDKNAEQDTDKGPKKSESVDKTASDEVIKNTDANANTSDVEVKTEKTKEAPPLPKGEGTSPTKTGVEVQTDVATKGKTIPEA